MLLEDDETMDDQTDDPPRVRALAQELPPHTEGGDHVGDFTPEL